MPALMEHISGVPEKPHPSSHDSGHEHSLDHWLEVYWLVEEEYLFAKDADREPHAVETEPPKHAAKSAGPHRKAALRR